MSSSLTILLINGTSRSKTASGPATVGCGWFMSDFVEQRLRLALEKRGHQNATITNIEPVSHFGLPLHISTVPAALKYYGKQWEYFDSSVRRWSDQVRAADAVIIVSPQYNNMPTPTLALSIDHLADEWESKLIGLITYGPAGGAHIGPILRDHACETLKFNLVEPFGSFKYSPDDGTHNRIQVGTAESIIEPQAEEADKTIDAVLNALA